MSRRVIWHLSEDVSDENYCLRFQVWRFGSQKKSHMIFFFGKALHIPNIACGEVFYPEDGSDPVMA